MLETCADVTPAVRYLAWYGTFQTFVFSSRSYLDLFLAANSRKHRSDVTEVHMGGPNSRGVLLFVGWGFLIWWLASQFEDHPSTSTKADSGVTTAERTGSSAVAPAHLSKKPSATKHKIPSYDETAGDSELVNTTGQQGARPEVPAEATFSIPDILAEVKSRDPQAADHIAAYCAAATAASNEHTSADEACRRNEVGAWRRLVEGNEFPGLDEVTRQKCREPPFPDSYVAKEACARYLLRAN